MKKIIGCKIEVELGDNNENRRSVKRKIEMDIEKIVMIEEKEEGYENIVRIVRSEFMDKNDGENIKIEDGWMKELYEDVIEIKGGNLGKIGR